jgi:hypothetical protein
MFLYVFEKHIIIKNNKNETYSRTKECEKYKIKYALQSIYKTCLFFIVKY